MKILIRNYVEFLLIAVIFNCLINALPQLHDDSKHISIGTSGEHGGHGASVPSSSRIANHEEEEENRNGDIIINIPEEHMNHDDNNNDDEENELCGICHEPFKTTNEITTFRSTEDKRTCQHYICSECAPHLPSRKCPFCLSAFVKLRQGIDITDVQAVFSELDIDGDNKLSKKEIENGLDMLFVNLARRKEAVRRHAIESLPRDVEIAISEFEYMWRRKGGLYDSLGVDYEVEIKDVVSLINHQAALNQEDDPQDLAGRIRRMRHYRLLSGCMVAVGLLGLVASLGSLTVYIISN